MTSPSVPDSVPRPPGQPRECSVVARYLPDPSLRYVKVRVGGSSLAYIVAVVLLSALALSCVLVPLWRLLAQRTIWLSSAAAIPGALLCVVLFRPLILVLREVRTRTFLWTTIKTLGLGLDRAVFQPGTAFRFEVHLPAMRPVELHEVQIRLVFWERWFERVNIPWSRMRRWVLRKQGHDLVLQTAPTLQLNGGQHGVVRGEIAVPMHRPTEHQRGKRKHLSYVNVTVTVHATDRRHKVVYTGDFPHLITFPWM
jgi:hypothetical protein